MSDTYGNHFQLDKTANLQSMKDLGLIKSDSNVITVGSHSLKINEHSVECTRCDEGKEVPELLQHSTGFRQVVYKLMLVGHFRDANCKPTPEEALQKQVVTTPANNHYDPNSVYWSDTTTSSGNTADLYMQKGTRIKADGQHYTYMGDGHWSDERGKILDNAELVHRHGDRALAQLPPQLADEMKLDMASQVQGGAPTLGGMQDMPGVSVTTTSSTAVDKDDATATIEGDTFREKMATKLCEKAGLR